MASRKGGNIECGLTLEDEFVLTRIRAKAHSLKSKDRDSYLWKTILKLICTERAYKTVLKEVGVRVDTNINLFDDEDTQPADHA
jgi:hypothetical protein